MNIDDQFTNYLGLVIIPIIAVIVSMLSAMYIKEQENNIHFMNTFNNVYEKIFAFR